MNPGKIVEPHHIDDNLRLGRGGYEPWEPATHFTYPDDHGSFAHATLRCVGIGKCRRKSSDEPGDDTMCPSYMVTHEEMHTTRGRAHLLWEMTQKDGPIADGWKDEHVKEALDLCLSCKGCKGDCPVNVDVATYKAEFLSHYWEGRIRPRYAYAFGLVDKRTTAGASSTWGFQPSRRSRGIGSRPGCSITTSLAWAIPPSRPMEPRTPHDRTICGARSPAITEPTAGSTRGPGAPARSSGWTPTVGCSARRRGPVWRARRSRPTRPGDGARGCERCWMRDDGGAFPWERRPEVKHVHLEAESIRRNPGKW